MTKKIKPKDSYIDVTAAIIRKENKILIARRNQTSPLPGQWEFPGGKVEEGETTTECLLRELEEELGIKVSILNPFLVHTHDYGREDGRKHRFWSFFCEILAGEPQKRVHDGFCWVEPEELEGFDLIEADKQLVEELLNNCPQL